jgi:hypothetical protein
MKITAKTSTVLAYWKLQAKYSKKNSCFVEMKSNSKIHNGPPNVWHQSTPTFCLVVLKLHAPIFQIIMKLKHF